MARARGIPVETIIVADDTALAATEEHAGARGIAGTILVHKVAGAAAAEGRPLAEVAALAEVPRNPSRAWASRFLLASFRQWASRASLCRRTRSSLVSASMASLGSDASPFGRQTTLSRNCLTRILLAHPSQAAGPVALLINNLGSTTFMELAIIGRHAISTLSARGFAVERVYTGTFMSSLEMAGVSLSVLRLNNERLRLLDSITAAPLGQMHPHNPEHRFLNGSSPLWSHLRRCPPSLGKRLFARLLTTRSKRRVPR